jgi:hypothetical protein
MWEQWWVLGQHYQNILYYRNIRQLGQQGQLDRSVPAVPMDQHYQSIL